MALSRALSAAEVDTLDLHAVAVSEETLLDYIAPDIHADAAERFEILGKQLTDSGYWRWLASLWVYHDVMWDSLPTWRRLFGSQRPERRRLMREYELEIFDALPAQVEVF